MDKLKIKLHSQESFEKYVYTIILCSTNVKYLKSDFICKFLKSHSIKLIKY